jgi:hypothetical protein
LAGTSILSVGTANQVRQRRERYLAKLGDIIDEDERIRKRHRDEMRALITSMGDEESPITATQATATFLPAQAAAVPVLANVVPGHPTAVLWPAMVEPVRSLDHVASAHVGSQPGRTDEGDHGNDESDLVDGDEHDDDNNDDLQR